MRNLKFGLKDEAANGPPAVKEDVVKPVSHRSQRTLAGSVDVHGIGYFTGKNVRLRFRPAPAGTGVVFHRTDLGSGACLPAHHAQVTGTQRRTTLGSGDLSVTMVEHVLAALAGLNIDNCAIELDAPEPPGLDGSARGFVEALRSVGSVCLPQIRPLWSVDRSILIQDGDCSLALHPSDGPGLRITYLLDYGDFSPLGRQSCTRTLDPAVFASEIAGCRTFLLEAEAHALRQQGIGKRTQLTDLLVFGPNGPIGNRLRFADEPARHKVLDIIGDLSLLGHALTGHVVAYRTGHPHNFALVQRLARALESDRRSAA